MRRGCLQERSTGLDRTFFHVGTSNFRLCLLWPSIRSRRSDQSVDRRADRPGRRDLDQSDRLEEGHIFTYEGGTLLSPPSPANRFRALPCTRTPFTVCASRMDLFIHPLHCDACSSSPFSYLSCNVSPAAVQYQGHSAASRLQGHPPASSSFWSKWLKKFYACGLRSSSSFACGGPRARDF